MEVSSFFERKVGTRLRHANETLKDQNVSNFLDTAVDIKYTTVVKSFLISSFPQISGLLFLLCQDACAVHKSMWEHPAGTSVNITI